jgi:hypothetical protein
MTQEIVTYGEIRKELRELCDKSETDKLAAKKLKVTPSTLSLTLRGKANVVPEKILKALKLKTEVVYVRTGKPKPKVAKTINTAAEIAPKHVPAIDEVSGEVVYRDIVTSDQAEPVDVIEVSSRGEEFIDVRSRD